jgi:hypothetical protein
MLVQSCYRVISTNYGDGDQSLVGRDGEEEVEGVLAK